VASRDDYRRILAHLRLHGYTAELGRRRNHYRVRDTEGRLIASFPGTPSDWRSYLNTISSLRQAGVPPLPPTRHKPKDKR
jgi:hypothetical protein